MKPATRNILLVLIGALILTIGIRISLSRDQPKSAPVLVRVLVAAHDLPAGLLLRSSELSWQDMQPGAVPKNAIQQNTTNIKTLQGSLLNRALSKGAPILSSDIISANDPGFLAATIKPGLRAVSVAINDVSGNAGLIQPGDYVDLLLTQTMRESKSAAHSVASETIATGLRVIAVGSALQRPKDGDSSSSSTSARTVSLEVTPRAAEVITLAARLGDLSFVLRSFATNDPSDPQALHAGSSVSADKLNINSTLPANGPIWAGDISQAAHAAAAVLTSTPVVVLRGSSNSTSGPEAPATPILQ